MPHCAVIWCNNQSKNVNKKNHGVTYHKFPQDPFLKDKWIRATGKCNWFPQKHDTVCSEHFDDDSFMKKASETSKTYLFLDAIPTMKLHPIFSEMDSRRKNNPTGLATENLLSDEGAPDLGTAVRIKEENPSDTETEIQIKEEAAPSDEGALDLGTPVRIKEEDPSDTETEIQITEEVAPDLTTTVQIKREDPLSLTEIIVEVPPIEPPKESRAPREAYYTINMNDSPQTRHLKRSLKAAQDTIRKQRLQVKQFRESNRRLTQKVAKMEKIIKCLREQSADK